MDFLDDQHMHRLYEKFIYEYYNKEFPNIKTSSPQINWAIDDGYFDMLPVMQSDVVLEQNSNILIIDHRADFCMMIAVSGTEKPITAVHRCGSEN